RVGAGAGRGDVGVRGPGRRPALLRQGHRPAPAPPAAVTAPARTRPGAEADVEVGRRPRYLLDREGVLGPLLLLPSVVYILALVGIPFFLAIGYSLSDVTVGDPSFDYVGLRNFRRVLDDPVFLRALRN